MDYTDEFPPEDLQPQRYLLANEFPVVAGQQQSGFNGGNSGLGDLRFDIRLRVFDVHSTYVQLSRNPPHGKNALPGDWIVLDQYNEFSIIPDSIFHSLYTLDEDPSPWDWRATLMM